MTRRAVTKRKIFFITLFQILLSTLVLFIVLEVLFRFWGAPGARSFVERIVIEEKLTRWKPAGEFRIFAFGESTIHGSHYAPVSSPIRWIEVYLKDFLPDKKIRVVNFARLGNGTDFAFSAFRDTLVYGPDAVIFYLGHNDFLYKSRKDHVLAMKSTWSYRLSRLIRRSWFLSTISRWIIQKRMELKGERFEDQIEFDIIESQPRGYGPENITPRSEPFYWENIDFFRQNVLKIVALARKKHIPFLFCKPVCNLKDFSPHHSVHQKKLSPENILSWESLYEEGKKKQSQGDWSGAREAFTQAYAVDSTYADLSFRLGQLNFKQGELQKAHELFEEARDNDAIITRATKEILQVFEELRRQDVFVFLDTEKLLVPEAPGGILGEPIIEDNVHLSLKGHSLLGRRLAEEIAERGWLAPKKEWRFERERSFDEIAQVLGVDEKLLISVYLRMVNYFGSRFDNRIRFAKKALEIDPKNSRALRYLAWTYWLMGEEEKALETYQDLEQVDPGALQEVFGVQPEIKKKGLLSSSKALAVR